MNKFFILCALFFAVSLSFNVALGIPQQPLVIGGENMTLGEFPFLVSIWRDGGFSCGGALISPDTVITVAYCVNEFNVGPWDPPSRVRVVAGDLLLFSRDEGEQSTVLQKITNHPNYIFNETHLLNNIAILTTATPFNLSSTVGLARLPSASTPTTSNGTAMGWGGIEWGPLPDPNPFPQKIKLQPGTQQDCKERFEFYGYDPFTMFCTFSMNQGMFINDLGDPFVAEDDVTFIGINNQNYWSGNSGQRLASSSFVFIPKFVDWIRNVTGINY